MLIGQPSEETIDGAKAMLADHLYERFGTPDHGRRPARHQRRLPAGTVSVISGATPWQAPPPSTSPSGASAATARAPQLGRDPIVMAAEFISRSRPSSAAKRIPQDPTVVTVGDIHGGTKRNIIPNEVKLELTTRSFSDHAPSAVHRRNQAEPPASPSLPELPDRQAPIVTVLDNESTPVEYNNPALTARVNAPHSCRRSVPNNVFDGRPSWAARTSASSAFAGHKIPDGYFRLGAMNPDRSPPPSRRQTAARPAQQPIPTRPRTNPPHRSHRHDLGRYRVAPIALNAPADNERCLHLRPGPHTSSHTAPSP